MKRRRHSDNSRQLKKVGSYYEVSSWSPGEHFRFFFVCDGWSSSVALTGSHVLLIIEPALRWAMTKNDGVFVSGLARSHGVREMFLAAATAERVAVFCSSSTLRQSAADGITAPEFMF